MEAGDLILKPDLRRSRPPRFSACFEATAIVAGHHSAKDATAIRRLDDSLAMLRTDESS